MPGVKRKISEVEDVEKQPIPSIKDLASSESKLRRQALQQILSHLEERSSATPLTTLQCQQLWRGFYVALYMHDSKNAISVQNLITTIAKTFSLIASKDEKSDKNVSVSATDIGNEFSKANNQDEDEDEFNGFDDEPVKNNGAKPSIGDIKVSQSWLSTYTTAFWTAMIKEWATIDSHRMNKYLLLIRMVLQELFLICAQTIADSHAGSTPQAESPAKPKSKTKSKSNQSRRSTIQSPKQPIRSTDQATALLKTQIDVLKTYPLNARDSKIPNGLKLHVLDIYTDELEKALKLTHTNELKEQGPTNDSSVPSTTNPTRLSKEMINVFKEPVDEMAKNGMDRNVRNRAKEEVEEFDRRITGQFSTEVKKNKMM